MNPAAPRRSPDAPITVLLTGDVMTGRGIDQALPHAGGPQLYEPYVRDARDYIRLAEQLNGKLELPLEPAYVWGDALSEIERVAPTALSAMYLSGLGTIDHTTPVGSRSSR